MSNNDVEINFVRRGEGKPILLIHGLGSSWRNWQPVMPMLSAQREVIAIDLPGYGDSPPLPGKVTIASLTDAVEVFIAEHDLGGVDLVGSSMGARMVLEMARRGHTGTVVALDPGGFWTDTQVRIFGVTVGASVAFVRRIQPLLPLLTRSRVGRTALPAIFRPSVAVATRPGVTGVAQFRPGHPARRGPARARLRTQTAGAGPGSFLANVVIGWGRDDRVTLPSQAARAQALFPGARLHWFDDCGHFPHWDQPEQTARVILDAA